MRILSIINLYIIYKYISALLALFVCCINLIAFETLENAEEMNFSWWPAILNIFICWID